MTNPAYKKPVYRWGFGRVFCFAGITLSIAALWLETVVEGDQGLDAVVAAYAMLLAAPVSDLLSLIGVLVLWCPPAWQRWHATGLSLWRNLLTGVVLVVLVIANAFTWAILGM